MRVNRLIIVSTTATLKSLTVGTQTTENPEQG